MGSRLRGMKRKRNINRREVESFSSNTKVNLYMHMRESCDSTFIQNSWLYDDQPIHTLETSCMNASNVSFGF